MIGRAGRFVQGAALLAFGISAGVLAWQHRDTLESAWTALRDWRAGPQEPSPELAAAAQAKLAALASAHDATRVSLTQAEVQSLVRYRIAAALPTYVIEPEIELRGDRLRIRAQVPTDLLPWTDDAIDVQEILPDTAVVTATAQLIPLDGERVGLAVDELTAARVPLPRAMIPMVLRRLGRDDEPGLPADALALPLPTGAGGAYIRRDRLVFVPRGHESR